MPIALLARAPLFLAVHPKVPVATLQEFIDHAKARPGQLTYGSSGVGSTHHLSMEAVKAALKLEMTHVPFRGTGQSVPALLGGHVDVLFSAYPSLSGAVTTNSVKLIATNGAKRSPQAPDLPPLADVIPGFDFAPIVGILGPAGTPAPVIQKIAAEAVAAVADPEIVRKLMAVGIEPAAGGPDDFARTLKSETDRVAQVWWRPQASSRNKAGRLARATGKLPLGARVRLRAAAAAVAYQALRARRVLSWIEGGRAMTSRVRIPGLLDVVRLDDPAVIRDFAKDSKARPRFRGRRAAAQPFSHAPDPQTLAGREW